MDQNPLSGSCQKEYFPYQNGLYGTNFPDIGVHVNESSGQVILVSALDNLTKGAVPGQAIQNLNITLWLAGNPRTVFSRECIPSEKLRLTRRDKDEKRLLDL